MTGAKLREAMGLLRSLKQQYPDDLDELLQQRFRKELESDPAIRRAIIEDLYRECLQELTGRTDVLESSLWPAYHFAATHPVLVATCLRNSVGPRFHRSRPAIGNDQQDRKGDQARCRAVDDWKAHANNREIESLDRKMRARADELSWHRAVERGRSNRAWEWIAGAVFVIVIILTGYRLVQTQRIGDNAERAATLTGDMRQGAGFELRRTGRQSQFRPPESKRSTQ